MTIKDEEVNVTMEPDPLVEVALDGAITTTTIRSDLEELVYEHVSFLRKLHRLGVSLTVPSKESLRRYVDLWLPLLSKLNPSSIIGIGGNHNEKLIPPADIAWLYHCHKLSPAKFEKYLSSEFGCQTVQKSLLIGNGVAPFEFLTQDSPGDYAAHSIELWGMHYPKEPFFLVAPSTLHSNETETKNTSILFLNRFGGPVKKLAKKYNPNPKHHLEIELLECAGRQGTFLWHISSDEFHIPNSAMALNPAFVKQAVENYEKFLQLQRRGPNHVLVPTYSIDLVWHTHILASVKQYNDDCVQLIGKRFDHDDTVPKGQLGDAFAKTCKLWNDNYGTDLKSFGGLSRGDSPPLTFFYRNWQNIGALPPTATTTMVATATPTATAVAVAVSTNDTTTADGATSNERSVADKAQEVRRTRMVILMVIVGLLATGAVVALTVSAVSYTHLTLPTNREV